MKIKLLLVLISMLTMGLHAQDQFATTTDGKKVLLKTDGTWEYVSSTSSTKNTSGEVPRISTSASIAKQKKKPSTRANISSKRRYIRRPRGGCYYINRNGNKTYVSRSSCN